MRPVIPVLVLAVTLGACATATPYQPADNYRHGYNDQKIESNRWAINFTGNTLTDRQTVETYLLYRAAELTDQNGFDHFQIVTRETDAQSSFISTSFSSPFLYNFSGFGPHSGFGRSRFHRSNFSGFRSGAFTVHDPFFGGPNSFQEQVNYEANAEILMHTGEKPTDAAYFSASEVLTNLSTTIVRPKTKT